MEEKYIKVRWKATPERKSLWTEKYHFEPHHIKMLPIDEAIKLKQLYPDNIIIEEEIIKEKRYLVRAKEKPEGFYVAVFMDNPWGSFSGGRYHTYFHANILADIFPTALVVDRPPKQFMLSFLNPKLDIIVDPLFGLEWDTNDFDFVLASPKIGGIKAFEYAKKWNLPVYLMVLEPPNFTKEYRGGIDTTEEYWKEYKECLLEADYIIPSTYLTAEYTKKWLENPKGKIFPIYAPLNYESANKIENIEGEHAIIWISRPVDFKRPYDAFLIAKELDPTLKIRYVSARSKLINDIKEEADRFGIDIETYDSILTDEDKFKLIKRSKFLVFSSCFEGFGLPPGEALLCGRPCLAYELPVLREIYKNKLDFAKRIDPNDLLCKAEKLLKDNKYRRKRGIEGKTFMKNHPSNPEKIKEKFLEIMPPPKVKKHFIIKKTPTISFFMIVFEGADLIENTLKCIYPHAYEILIAEGAVELMAKVKGYHRSKDGTVEKILNFPDPERKIILIQKPSAWKDKAEMKNMLIKLATGNILWQVDVDEMYLAEDIKRIRKIFKDNPNIDIVSFQAYHFWKDTSHIVIGDKWDRYEPRVWRRKGDLEYKYHNYPHRDGKPYTSENFAEYKINKRIRFHYGYVRNKKVIESKICFMSMRDKGKYQEEYKRDLEFWVSNEKTMGGIKVVEFKGGHPND